MHLFTMPCVTFSVNGALENDRVASSKPPSNSSQALERLRAIVLDHEDEADFQLPTERELAQSMGLGRRAVRRALEVLEAEGLIWRRQGKGTFLGNGPLDTAGDLYDLASRTNPSQVMETRLVLEPGIARLAALRASRQDVEALERLARRTATAGDDDGWELWDSVFHRRIAQCTGNHALITIFEALDRVRQEPEWRQLRASIRTEKRRQRVFREHDEIVAAIARRDGVGAEQAMRQHLRAIEENLRALITGEHPSLRQQDEGDAKTVPEAPVHEERTNG
jgi:DNA-binding FadR family transcriptional regulator